MRELIYTITILISLLFVNVPGKAQTSSLMEEVAHCIREGNVESLSAFLNENTEITLEGERKDYAKTQAKYVLREFFRDHPPSAFSLLHEGNTGETMYALGEYRSGEYQVEVNIFLKPFGDTYLIDQIRFEKK